MRHEVEGADYHLACFSRALPRVRAVASRLQVETATKCMPRALSENEEPNLFLVSSNRRIACKTDCRCVPRRNRILGFVRYLPATKPTIAQALPKPCAPPLDLCIAYRCLLSLLGVRTPLAMRTISKNRGCKSGSPSPASARGRSPKRRNSLLEGLDGNVTFPRIVRKDVRAIQAFALQCEVTSTWTQSRTATGGLKGTALTKFRKSSAQRCWRTASNI